MANTREPILQPIPILSLRPTQMTVGMREVKEKRKRWREHKSKKKQAELLGKHMIPVVLGPDKTTTWSIIIIWRARCTTRASRTFWSPSSAISRWSSAMRSGA